MAKTKSKSIGVFDTYQRILPDGSIQTRKFNSVPRMASRVARKHTAEQGWVKVATPVGVDSPKKGKAPKVHVEEQPEINVEEA